MVNGANIAKLYEQSFHTAIRNLETITLWLNIMPTCKCLAGTYIFIPTFLHLYWFKFTRVLNEDKYVLQLSDIDIL
jgi:hypothetical protein